MELNEQDIEHACWSGRDELDGLILSIIQITDRDFCRPIIWRNQPVGCWISAISSLGRVCSSDRSRWRHNGRCRACQQRRCVLCLRFDLYSCVAGESVLEIAECESDG